MPEQQDVFGDEEPDWMGPSCDTGTCEKLARITAGEHAGYLALTFTANAANMDSVVLATPDELTAFAKRWLNDTYYD